MDSHERINEQEIHMNKTESWTFKHAGLTVTVKHWGVERDGLCAMNNGKGVWNYYVFLHESELGEKFSEVWLPDKITRFREESPERVTHDYEFAPFADADWHGGITYYMKHGQVNGHRSVELGCDFNHFHDMKRGYDYTLDEVVAEAKRTAERLASIYLNVANT